MADFEFARNVTVGQYLPTGSPIHALDPRVRLGAGALLLIACTVTPGIAGLGIAILALMALLAVARIPLGYALRGLLPPLPFILFLAVLQVFVGPQKDTLPLLVQWGLIRLSTADLLAAVILIARFACLILTLSLVSFCISTPELVHGLEGLLRPLEKIRVPVQDFVLMVQVALRFLPLLAQEAERIAKAQASRGADWGATGGGPVRRARQVMPLLVPLFLTSLHRAENLAVAMDARGYGDSRRRTSMSEARFGAGEVVALLVTVAIVAAVWAGGALVR